MVNGTLPPPIEKSSEERKKDSQRAKCQALGGEYDEATGNCENIPGDKPNTSKESVETPKGDFLGLNKTDAELLRSQFNGQAGTSQVPVTQAAPLGTAARAASDAAVREQQVSETGILEQTPPTLAEQEITIEPTGAKGEDLPLFGPSLGSLEALKQARQQEQQIFNAKGELNTAIQKEGLSESEKFGVFVEAIPIAGKLAGEYAQGLDTPTENIRDIVTTINGMREAAEFQATQAASGKVDPNTALNTIINMQDRVEEMEARLHYLIQFSTSLRTSSDEVNKIEVEIFRTKQKLFVAGQTAAAGAVSEPSELDIFMTLDEVKKRAKE